PNWFDWFVFLFDYATRSVSRRMSVLGDRMIRVCIHKWVQSFLLSLELATLDYRRDSGNHSITPTLIVLVVAYFCMNLILIYINLILIYIIYNILILIS